MTTGGARATGVLRTLLQMTAIGAKQPRSLSARSGQMTFSRIESADLIAGSGEISRNEPDVAASADP
jgi:hypothetical protein